MTKKKSKKSQKANQQPAPSVETAKKEDEIDMLEDIKRDEDLYISESDVTNISNFIRTTNKSFNSLGNTVVEKFAGRCALAILHALIALFDQDSEDREDVIRRLNIIYIVWRLPEIESELKLKSTKSMADVYSHPFSSFLFFAERLNKFKVESSLARIIVTNNVGIVEKLTAPDFMSKASKLDAYKVDAEGWEKWEEANSAHWPEITEEMVSLSKAMRELGCERKDHEAGMAEAFYPLVHNPPTLLPPKMVPLDSEDPTMAQYCFRESKKPENQKKRDEIVYPVNPDDSIRKRLLDAFKEMEPTMINHQKTVFTGMTDLEIKEAQREITIGDTWIPSSESEYGSDDDEEDSDEEQAAEEFRAMTAAATEHNERTIEGCVDRILKGVSLTTSKCEIMALFVKNCNITHPQYTKLLTASQTDDVIIHMIKTNAKFANAFLVRNALSEQGTSMLFNRYIRICQEISPLIHALEIVMKLAKEFQEHQKMGPEQKATVLNYVRCMVKQCEGSEYSVARHIRLISMLIRKLLREAIVHVDEIAADVKPFTLRYTDSRECTALYQFITGLQKGTCTIHDPPPVVHGKSSMTTTTTTVNQAGSTTTTTTVVQQTKHGQTVKSTSRKVVLQGTTGSLKAMSIMRKAANAAFKGKTPSSVSITATHSVGASSSGPSSAGPSEETVIYRNQGQGDFGADGKVTNAPDSQEESEDSDS